MLDCADKALKEQYQADLRKILREEEAKWRQTSHEIELHDGYLNTRYYHAKANGRRSRNKIYSLI